MKTAKRDASRDIDVADEKLLERLHDTSWPILFQLANNKLGDVDDASDLLQELFIELWNKRHIFPLGELSLAWLKKRLWYKLIMHFRNKGFKQRHLENFRTFMETEQLAFQPGESSDHAFEEQFELIMEVITLAVAQMPDRMREVFLLKRDHQFTINEIAQRLDLSPNTVRNHLQAAMKRLRSELETQHLSTLGFALACWIISG